MTKKGGKKLEKTQILYVLDVISGPRGIQRGLKGLKRYNKVKWVKGGSS